MRRALHRHKSWRRRGWGDGGGDHGACRVTVTAGELATFASVPSRVVVQAGDEVQVQAAAMTRRGPCSIAPTGVSPLTLGSCGTGVFRAQHAGQGRIRAEVDPGRWWPKFPSKSSRRRSTGSRCSRRRSP